MDDLIFVKCDCIYLKNDARTNLMRFIELQRIFTAANGHFKKYTFYSFYEMEITCYSRSITGRVGGVRASCRGRCMDRMHSFPRPVDDAAVVVVVGCIGVERTCLRTLVRSKQWFLSTFKEKFSFKVGFHSVFLRNSWPFWPISYSIFSQGFCVFTCCCW